jgi:hypothetical protein
MRISRSLAVLLLTWLLSSLFTATQAGDGILVNEKQEPIEGARVCYFVGNIELICSLTDEKGRYELPVSQTDTIRAHAEGYNPRIFSSAAEQGLVTLQRAPVLHVRLIDRASGERLEKAEVMVSYPSGKELGPFPANKAGLRIRRGLPVGEIRVVGKADGFLDSDPVAVTLKAGEPSDVTIQLTAIEPRKAD